jgi:acetyl-CoA synthetase
MHVSYSQLHRGVSEAAAVLRDSLGLTAGGRVTLRMPMVPELAVTMLACVRLGVIHSQVFGGSAVPRAVTGSPIPAAAS